MKSIVKKKKNNMNKELFKWFKKPSYKKNKNYNNKKMIKINKIKKWTNNLFKVAKKGKKDEEN